MEAAILACLAEPFALDGAARLLIVPLAPRPYSRVAPLATHSLCVCAVPLILSVIIYVRTVSTCICALVSSLCTGVRTISDCPRLILEYV